jgi:hypothetical protein
MDAGTISQLWGSVPDELKDVATILTVLNIIATFTPTPIDNVILVALRKALNLGALNFGESKNAKTPGAGSADV